MSRDVGLYCATHNEGNVYGMLNHGEEYLRAVWALREGIAMIREADPEGNIEFEHFMWGSGGGFNGLTYFIAKHKDCHVVFRDEYGEEQPIDDEPCSAKMYMQPTPSARSRILLRCQRGSHSSGRHRCKDKGYTVEWDR